MGQYLDIIVFAVIAVVLLLRLRSVLGTRNEGEQDAPPLKTLQDAESRALQNPADGKALSANALAAPAQGGSHERWAQASPNFNLVDTATVHNSLGQFLAADPAFRPGDFLEKAKKAFMLIVSAFAGGNKNTLELLLTQDLLAGFNALLEARDTARETYHAEVHGIKKALITDADLDGTTARVTVDFTAEQSITHKDAEGRIIEGNDGHRRTTRDRWVFTKDLMNPAPTWLLAEILVHED